MLDTAAGLNGVTEVVVRASDFVLVPQQSEPLAVRSLPPAARKPSGVFRTEGLGGYEWQEFCSPWCRPSHEASIKVARELQQMLSSIAPFSRTTYRGIPSFWKRVLLAFRFSLVRKNPPPAALLFDQLAADLEERIGLTSQKENTYTHATLLD